ncbi:hypothetical protein NP945_31755 [Mesorhizobium sp. LMG17149]|nr:hypothetical protein [Mesorhizobium sp. LMG17149]
MQEVAEKTQAVYAELDVAKRELASMKNLECAHSPPVTAPFGCRRT